MNKKVRQIVEIVLGTTVMSLGFYFFILPQGLVTGGVMGISVILEKKLSITPSIFMYIANVVLLLIGLIALGKKFFFKTIIATLLSPTIIFILEKTVSSSIITEQFSSNTTSLIITSIFGGLLVGVGLGVVIRNDATTGGIDVIQNILHKFLKVPFSVVLYAIDGIIVVLGMVFGIGIENGFFAIICLFITGIMIDYVSLNGKKTYSVFIITSCVDEMKNAIFAEVNRGLTRLKIVGGYSNIEKEMIICIINPRQLYLLKEVISKVDNNAFTFVVRAKEALGKGFQEVESND